MGLVTRGFCGTCGCGSRCTFYFAEILHIKCNIHTFYMTPTHTCKKKKKHFWCPGCGHNGSWELLKVLCFIRFVVIWHKWWCIKMSCKELCWLESPNSMKLNSSCHFQGYINLCLWERKKMFISINCISYSHRNTKDTLNVKNSFRSTKMMEMLTSIKTKLHLSVFNVHFTDHMKHFICGFINGWLITVRYFSGQ